MGQPPVTMLQELTIENFAIVERLRLSFEPGFNVLTGETGAGKSIVVDALGAVLGERVTADIVRDGADAARVEAVFQHDGDARLTIAGLLREYGLAEEEDSDQLILRREVTAGGRSLARVNGRTVTIGTLARFGACLVDIHGQSEHLSLLRPATHLDYLDRFAGLAEEREELAERVRELAAVRESLAAFTRERRDRERRLELLRFQVAEIDAAQLRPGEEEQLQAERLLLGSAERLAELAATAYEELNGAGDDFGSPGDARAVLDGLRSAVAALAELARLDPALNGLHQQVEEQLYLLEDAATSLRDYRERIEANPARLLVIEERLGFLKDLRRKYGATIGEVLAFADHARAELATMERADADISALSARADALRGELGARASALRLKRKRAAIRLGDAVETTLAELNMGRARFAVRLGLRDDPAGLVLDTGDQDGARTVACDQSGVDVVEFTIAANAGETLKPLARVASGGEMARFMLALKSVLARADTTPTLVFDEVDVGVGGRGGQVVGEKLWNLTAGRHQVLCISHLPQVAAFADQHFHISKRELESRTVTSVSLVAGDERVDELAAMLDGVPISTAARANARELLNRVGRWKAGRLAAARAATPVRLDRTRKIPSRSS